MSKTKNRQLLDIEFKRQPEKGTSLYLKLDSELAKLFKGRKINNSNSWRLEDNTEACFFNKQTKMEAFITDYNTRQQRNFGGGTLALIYDNYGGQLVNYLSSESLQINLAPLRTKDIEKGITFKFDESILESELKEYCRGLSDFIEVYYNFHFKPLKIKSTIEVSN